MNVPRCSVCGGPLSRFQDEVYCERCLAFGLTCPPQFIDAHGKRYQGGPVLPYSELVEGSFFALPGEHVVRVRGRVGLADLPALRQQMPEVVGALYHRPVLLLERVDPADPDRIIDLVDEPPC